MSIATARFTPAACLRLCEPPDLHQASPLHARISDVVAGLSFRELAEATGLNAETVRRYVRGAEPSVAFITALCDAFDLSSEWLLYGRGPRGRTDAVEELLRSAGYSRLLAALAERLEDAECR